MAKRGGLFFGLEGVPPELAQALERAFDDYASRLDKLESKPIDQQTQSSDFVAKPGQTLTLEAPGAGMNGLLVQANRFNKGQRVTFIQNNTNPVRFRAVDGTVNGVASVVSILRGTYDAVSDGAGGWLFPQLLTATGALPAVPGAIPSLQPFCFEPDFAAEPGEFFPRGFANALQAWPRSGGSNVWMDAGQYLNFGLEGPATANAQIRSGDAVFRIRCANQVSVIGDTNLVLAANGVAGLVAIQATDTNGTVSLATAGALRVVIAGTGEWTTPAGALGNVWTHQGLGVPPTWAAGGGGATGPTGPMGPSGGDGSDGSDGIQGPAGAPGAAGATGATGATGASGSAGAAGLVPLLFDSDTPEPPSDFIVRPGWANALLSNPRSGGSSPVVDFGQVMTWAGNTGVGVSIGVQVASNNGQIGSTNGSLTLSAATLISQNASAGIWSATATDDINLTSGVTAANGITLSANTKTIALTTTTAGSVHVANNLCVGQQAASTFAVAATDGMYWVRNDAASMPMFTDSANVDCPIKNSVATKAAANVVSALTTVLDCAGSFAIPANTLRVGSRFCVEFTYQYIRGATATAHNLTHTLNGGAGLAFVIGRPATAVAGTYQMRCLADFTVLTTGVGGTCMVNIYLGGAAITDGADLAARYASSVAGAINTTIANTITATVAMTVAVAATSITATGGHIDWKA